MKALSLSLLIFAMVILLSSALPGKEKDKSSKLVVSEHPGANGKSLQRRKPPIKTPGPKLTEERDSESSSELSKTENNDGHKGKKHIRSDNSREKNDSSELGSSNGNKGKKHIRSDNSREKNDSSELGSSNGNKGKKHLRSDGSREKNDSSELGSSNGNKGKKHLRSDGSREKNDSSRSDSLNGNGKNGKKHRVHGGRYNGDRKEETQEERTSLL